MSAGMNPSALTPADLVFLLQVGTCVDTRDGLSLTSATEPLRESLLELERLRLWREAVRAAVHAGCSGFEALDRANVEAFGV